MSKFTGDRFGIVLIIATLLVILLIAGQLLLHAQQSRDAAIKVEGRNIAQLLSNLPFKQLVPEQRRNGILELLNSKQGNSDFAYAAIVTLEGQPLAVTAAGEAIIPKVNIANEKNLWATELEIAGQNNQRSLLEFRAPVLNAGELVGYARVGYFKPDLELAEIPFIAQLALPIFLLVPLTYLMIRRELRPLKQASIEINAAMQKQRIAGISEPEDEFQDFMNNFKRFMQEIDKRFGELSQQNLSTKAASLTLSYQRQRTESALQALPDAILVIDETGKAIFANSKLIPLIGGDLNRIIGAMPHEWCENPDILTLLAKYQQQLHRLQRSDSVEFQPAHNPTITVSVSAYPLFTPKDTDTICGTLVVFKDKTREVLANQARETFISHVAHELKSPLNVIHLYAESLLEPDIAQDQLITSINVINDEVERLSTLINNLLNISKIEAGNIVLNMQRIMLHEFLNDTFNSIARAAANDKQLQFEVDLPRNLPNVQIDKDLFRIALNNLLTNAVKYNKSGGKVSLSAEETKNEIILKITDTGIGIAEKDQAKIFDKFYRSDADEVTQRSGHGLGLALAKEIIDLHQGKLYLQSTAGIGSVFTIELKKTSVFIK